MQGNKRGRDEGYERIDGALTLWFRKNRKWKSIFLNRDHRGKENVTKQLSQMLSSQKSLISPPCLQWCPCAGYWAHCSFLALSSYFWLWVCWFLCHCGYFVCYCCFSDQKLSYGGVSCSWHIYCVTHWSSCWDKQSSSLFEVCLVCFWWSWSFYILILFMLKGEYYVGCAVCVLGCSCLALLLFWLLVDDPNTVLPCFFFFFFFLWKVYKSVAIYVAQYLAISFALSFWKN